MALARRGMNQALVQTGVRSTFDPNSDSWANFSEGTTSFVNQPNDEMADNDSIEALEERAKRVIRDSGANKRTIPPFVQKLAR